MPDRIRERLQGAGGHRVLHLFSGTGRESVDLAGLGALVTGVDDDEAAIESARRRAPELPWVHADPHALPPELLLGRWDLVYLGYGSLRRLRAADPSPAASPRRCGPEACSCSTTSIRPQLPRRLRPLARRLLRLGRIGELVTAVAAAGPHAARPRGMAGQDTHVPGHLVLAAEKPGA